MRVNKVFDVEGSKVLVTEWLKSYYTSQKDMEFSLKEVRYHLWYFCTVRGIGTKFFMFLLAVLLEKKILKRVGSTPEEKPQPLYKVVLGG